MHRLTIIILTRNAEKTILQTLQSVSFADDILVVDDNSSDSTVSLCKNKNIRLVEYAADSFSEKRTYALSLVNNDWVFYVDADEVVTPELAKRVSKIVETNIPGAYRILRKNVFLGTQMYPDCVDRLFHISVIEGWEGKVHESPKLNVELLTIEEPLLHFTHRDITSMLAKTNEWSEYEAELRLNAHHPPVAWWRLIRIGITFFCQNYFGKKLYKFGRPGLFESYFQMLDKLVVYTKLWERQQKVAQ